MIQYAYISNTKQKYLFEWGKLKAKYCRNAKRLTKFMQWVSGRGGNLSDLIMITLSLLILLSMQFYIFYITTFQHTRYISNLIRSVLYHFMVLFYVLW